MWYIDKSGDAYCIQDLIELMVSENFSLQDDVTAYDLDAKYAGRDHLTLATFLSKEDCFKFRDGFLHCYVSNVPIKNYAALMEESGK